MPGPLVLACGNTLRGDDGVGWVIARILEQDPDLAGVEVLFTHQWTPELSVAISVADVVIFVDCSSIAAAGAVTTTMIQPSPEAASTNTHHTDPASLLALARELYLRLPNYAYAVTVGGASYALSEDLSEAVRQAVPAAVNEVKRLLAEMSGSPMPRL